MFPQLKKAGLLFALPLVVVLGDATAMAGIEIPRRPRPGGRYAPVPAPAPTSPQVPGSAIYSPQLGIWYYRVPNSDGTFSVRVTGYPLYGSAAGQLQLEPGDTILSLDNLPFYSSYDVENHYGQTTVIFINIRTGRPQYGVIYIQ